MPVRVGDDLHFDVVRALDVSLEIHLGPAEVGFRFPRGALGRLAQPAGVAH